MASERFRILEYSAENFKRLRLAHFRPKGRVTMITGKNDQGKSSVLDSVLYVFGGAKAAPEMPMRKGASKLEVKLDLGKLVASRTHTRLTVTPAPGEKAWNTPQAMLDSIYDELAFNPQQFAQMGAEEQAQMLTRAVGLEAKLQELDDANREDYETRKTVNADVKRLTAEAALIPVQDGLPVEKIDETAIQQRLRAANEENRRLAARIEERQRATEKLRQAEEAEKRHDELVAAQREIVRVESGAIKELTVLQEWEAYSAAAIDEVLTRRTNLDCGQFADELLPALQRAALVAEPSIEATGRTRAEKELRVATAKEVLAAAAAEEESVREKVIEARSALEGMPTPALIDAASIVEELTAAQLVNREIDKRTRRDAVEKARREKEAESARLSRQMEDRDEEKRAAVANATMPLPGLTLGEKSVLFDGIPVKQLGEAKQILLGVAIAIARDPQLRLVLIPHGEALDDESWEKLAQMAEEKDFYVWAAKVDSTGEVGIYIEDGMIKADNS